MAVKPDDALGNLYAHYMTLDAEPDETKLQHRDKYTYILSAVHLKDQAGARKLSADFIGKFFKFFPDDAERSVQALASLCIDTEAAIRKAGTETLVEICRVNPSYVKRVADLLIQMYGLADATESKGLQQCLVKLLKIEPRQALEGLLDQIVTAEDVIRQPAIKFLRTKLGEVLPAASNSDLATFLIQEYRKIIPDTTAEEFENLVESLSGMKFFQTLTGAQMLVDMLTDSVSAGPSYRLKTKDQAERLINSCRLALPSFSRMIQSTKIVEYFCDEVIPSVSAENPDPDVPALQVFTELCTSVGELKRYKENLTAIVNKIQELLPEPSLDSTTAAVQESLPKLKFAAVECLLCALHMLGKRHPDFFTEPEQSEAVKTLKLRLQYFSSCMQMYMQMMSGGKLNAAEPEAAKKAEAVRRVISNIRTLILDFFHTPPHFKAPIHLSWKKETALADKTLHPRIEGTVSTKRKIDDSNGTKDGKIRTKYAPGTGRNGATSAIRTIATPKTATVRSIGSSTDQAKLDARAKRFGGSTASSEANEGTNRLTKKIRKQI